MNDSAPIHLALVSLDFDIARQANFKIKTTLEIKELLVSFDSEIRSALDIELMRISESGH